MKIIKNILISTVLFLIPFVAKVNATNTVDIYFFRGEGCPHCAKEEIALEELKDKYSNLVIHDYEVWYDKDNQKILQEVGDLLEVNISGVPFTVIGDKHYVGFDEDNTKNLLEEQIIEYSNGEYQNVVGDYLKGITKETDPKKDDVTIPKEESNYKVNIPLIGKVAIKDLSLPVIAIVLGALDGFNPCAMWVLLFLISMLLGMENRKRMWTLGITFLITSALVYMLFMMAWLSFTSVIGTVIWLRLLIALIALIGGVINLNSYYKARKENGCDVIDDGKRKKLFAKIKHITHERSFFLAMAGVMFLAASVNIVELACSAGFPVVFTSILTVNDLSSIQYFMYILLYILFFLIDDVIIFIIAMTTLEVAGISTKYGKMSHLIGGILMILIGCLLIFKPEWLMFNF